mgnify:CR=1 FL=1
MESKHFDVVVVGAGISGIGAGYYLQTKSPTNHFALLKEEKALVEHGIFFNTQV